MNAAVNTIRNDVSVDYRPVLVFTTNNLTTVITRPVTAHQLCYFSLKNFFVSLPKRYDEGVVCWVGRLVSIKLLKHYELIWIKKF